MNDNGYIGDAAYLDLIGEEIGEVNETEDNECWFDAFERLDFVYRKVRELEQDLVEAHCTLAKRERHHKRVEDVLRARLAAVSDVVAEFRTESDSRKYIDYQGHCVQDMCANRVEEALF